MTLQNVALQSAGEQVASGIGIIIEGFYGTLGIVAIAVIIGMGLLVGLGIIIYIKKKFNFEGTGKPIGHFKIIIQDGDTLEGNVSRWEEVTDDEFEMIAEAEPDFELMPDILRQMRVTEEVGIYRFKNTDDTDVLETMGKHIYLIVSGKIESDMYSYVVGNANFTWRSIFSKEATRNVLAFNCSKKVTIINQDRNKDDWYFIVPVPSVRPKTGVIGFDSRMIKGMQYYIDERPITNAKPLAMRLSYSVYVKKSEEVNQQLRDELAQKDKLLTERTTQLNARNVKLAGKSLKLATKDWVVDSKVKIEERVTISLMHVLGALGFGGIMVIMLPTIFPSVALLQMQFVALMIAIIVIGVAFKYGLMQTQKVDDDNVVVETG